MSLIPGFYVNSVVAIGIERDGKTNWSATGFLFGSSHKGEKGQNGQPLFETFLVTNRHVLDGKEKVTLRFNAKEGGTAREYPLQLISNGSRLWKPHPNQGIDVAVISINGKLLQEHKIEFGFFEDNSHALYKSDFLSKGFGEGDGIFVLGFPMGYAGLQKNFVVVRQGCIARSKDCASGHTSEFLIDAPVFPGNSGGPVINRPEQVAITGTKNMDSAYLVGVVAGYLPYSDVAISAQTGKTRVVFEENSGLSVVFPCDYIREAIVS